MKILALAASTLILAPAFANATTVAGCSDDDYVQLAANSPLTIKTAGMDYTPRCLEVRVGDTVTIQASGFHPVQGMPDIAGVPNPIFNPRGASADSVQVTFSEAGHYGYFCVRHGDETGEGMAGAIRVIE